MRCSSGQSDATCGCTPILRALRPIQWTKNALLFVPMLAGHAMSVENVATLILGVICFCALASGGYLLNDLHDVKADQLHPTKRNRPIAAGLLQRRTAVLLATGLWVGAMLLALFLSTPFAWLCFLYAIMTVGYSFLFKNWLLIDVVVLALLYVLRIWAGGVVIGVPPSDWLLAFSLFLFLSLAMVKRYAELKQSEDQAASQLPGRGYQVRDAMMICVMGLSSGYLSVLVLALYVNSEAVSLLYHAPEWLWFVIPVFWVWISRLWLLAHRGHMQDDPVAFAIRDPLSYVALLLMACVAWLATVL